MSSLGAGHSVERGLQAGHPFIAAVEQERAHPVLPAIGHSRQVFQVQVEQASLARAPNPALVIKYELGHIVVM